MHRFLFGFSLIFLTIFSQPAFSQEIVNRQLPNGLEVIVIPNDNVPLVTIEICVKNGAFTEPAEFNGLSHLYEHMYFKGNESIPTQEAYLRRMKQLGMEFNGTTSVERVNYYYTMPADKLKEGLEFMRDAIKTPKFDPDEFQKEIKVVLGEVDRNESSPFYWMNQAVNQLLWYQYPSRKDSLGDRETITTATVEKMKIMKETYYLPNNSAIVIAGDVNATTAFGLVSELFSSWKRGPDPFVKNPVPEHPPLKKNEYVVIEKEVKVPTFRFSWHGPSVTKDPKSTFGADVLSYILTQPTSSFYKNLIESGIVLSAQLQYWTQRTTGPIDLYVQVQPDKLEKAIPLVLEELRKFTLPNYYTDEHIESAKTMLAIDDLYQREKTSEFAHTVSFWWASASLTYYREYIKNLKAVSRADINKYVSQYISGKPFVTSLLISPSQAKELGMTNAKLQTLVKSAGN